MFHIYYFNNDPFSGMDDSFYRFQNLEKLKRLLQNLPECHGQKLDLFYYRFSSGNADDAVISFFELFSRVRVRRPYILVFNTLSDLCVLPANALKILRRWKDKVDPDAKFYFTDYGFSDFDNIDEQLHDYYDIPKTSTRVNLVNVFPYTLGAVEEMRNDDSPNATLGQSPDVLSKLQNDYNRFISIKAVADYLNEEVRSLNQVLRPSEGSEAVPRGIKIGKLQILSAEQKNILKKALEKDYQDACRSISIKVLHKKYVCQWKNEKIDLEEMSGN